MGARIKRLISSLCALVVGAAIVAMPAVAESPTENAEDINTTGSVNNVPEISKIATDLDKDGNTIVSLGIGADEEKTASDVVFVLDKSASTDIREEAANMLAELQKQSEEGNIIKVGVVNFETGILDSLELTELNDDNWNTISKHVIFHEADSSGTNIPAGIAAGKAMLDADTAVKEENKHLVLVTDGVGYLWGNADSADDGSNVYTIYSENVSNGEENLYASHETIDWHHKDASYYDEFSNIAQWYENHSEYGELIAKYQNTFGRQTQYKASDNNVVQHKGQETDWSVIGKFSQEYSYVPVENQNASIPTAADGAMYKVAELWTSIKDAGYNAYAYEDPRYSKNGQYIWAAKAISSLRTIGGYSSTLPDNKADYDGMFDNVKSSVLYAIENGTVNDVIGKNFDLVSLDTLSLTVGEQVFTPTVSGNTANFGTPDENGVYPYSVTYTRTTDANGDEVDEFFDWQINTPVEKSNPISLSYTLHLVNREDVTGDYTVPTNESAELTYKSTDTKEEKGPLVFPVPEVTYHVASIQPADMTIYMGGTNGYEGVMSDTGVETENSLPEPGYYLTLPDAVNDALGQIVSSGEPVNLSDYVNITGKDSEGNIYTWTLEQYGATYSAAYNKFIYRIVPAEGTMPVRLMFQDEAGNLYDSDTFNPAEEDALNHQYQMRIYSGLTAEDLVEITVSVPNGSSYACTLKTQPGALNIRYVTGDQNSVVTPSYTSVEEASQADDPSQTALKKAYVIADEDTQFFINDSQVDVTDEAAVSLLFDDIVSSDTTEGAGNYRDVLVNKALEQLNLSAETTINTQEKYLDLVDANNGNVWLTPGKDVTVYWPYPENTNASTKFYLVHFKGLDREMNMDSIETEIANAEVEVLPVTTDEYGVSFTTDSFSPYVLVWAEEPSDTPVKPVEPDTGVIETGVWTNPVPFAVTFTASMAAVLAILYRRLH